MVRGCSQCLPSDAGCFAGLLGGIRPKVVFTLWEDAGKSHKREKHVPLESQSSTDFDAAIFFLNKNNEIMILKYLYSSTTAQRLFSKQI